MVVSYLPYVLTNWDNSLICFVRSCGMLFASNCDPQNPNVWCSLGVLYYQLHQNRDALDAYTRAIKLDPHLCEVRVEALNDVHHSSSGRVVFPFSSISLCLIIAIIFWTRHNPVSFCYLQGYSFNRCSLQIVFRMPRAVTSKVCIR